MISAKKTSRLLVRFISALSALAFIALASPIIPEVVHGMVHDKGISHSHGPHGSTEHEHDHGTPTPDTPSFSRIHIDLQFSPSFVAPLKYSVDSFVACELVALSSVLVPSKIILFSGAPPSSTFLLTLIAAHPNKAPPSA